MLPRCWPKTVFVAKSLILALVLELAATLWNGSHHRHLQAKESKISRRQPKNSPQESCSASRWAVDSTLIACQLKFRWRTTRVSSPQSVSASLTALQIIRWVCLLCPCLKRVSERKLAKFRIVDLTRCSSTLIVKLTVNWWRTTSEKKLLIQRWWQPET